MSKKRFAAWAAKCLRAILARVGPDLDGTIKRLTVFAEVGADVLYAPYPGNMDDVHAIVRAVTPKPVNLVVGTSFSDALLGFALLGYLPIFARISFVRLSKSSRKT